jgi:hypothetical protein
MLMTSSGTRWQFDPGLLCYDSYSIQIADTVKIGQDTGILITEGTKKVHEVILDEDEEEEVNAGPEPSDRTPLICPIS